MAAITNSDDDVGMELTPLKSFLAVAREGNMTRAARRVHLSQPAISAQIARLEEELGTPLFHRTAKGVELTEAGVIFRHHAERALVWIEDGQEAVRALEGLDHGELSVGGGATATTYLFPPLLRAFHEQHPGVRLYVREQGSAAVAEGVLTGDLDLGVVTLPIDAPGLDSLTVTPWVTDDLRLVVPPGHPLEKRRRFQWSELEGEPLVLFEAGTAVRRVIEQALATYGVHAEIVMELRSIESIRQMVAQGIGSAFVSRFALPGEDAGLAPAEGVAELRRDLAIVQRSDRAATPAARAFLDLMAHPDPRQLTHPEVPPPIRRGLSSHRP